MRPTRCPSCQGDHLVHGPKILAVSFVYEVWAAIFARRFIRGGHQAVCLDCGVMTNYLGEAALGQLREWQDQAHQQKISVGDF